MDKYCSSMVHLLRGRELGFRNALTGNVTTRCAKHKMLQMCGNMYDCNGLFSERAYSYLITCYGMMRGFRNGNCNDEEMEIIHGFRYVYERYHVKEEEEEEEEITSIRDEIDMDLLVDVMEPLCHPYKYNVVKEYDDIYIEVRSCLDGELKMTIDAKKIIHLLSVPLEDEEWEKLREKRLGPLIGRYYWDIFDSVGVFSDSAARILKNGTTEEMWEGCRLKRGVWNHYYVSYSRDPLILPRAAFKDEL